MDKLAVKTIHMDTCPQCGRRTTVDGGVTRCPVHGSEPFESDQDEARPSDDVSGP